MPTRLPCGLVVGLTMLCLLALCNVPKRLASSSDALAFPPITDILLWAPCDKLLPTLSVPLPCTYNDDSFNDLRSAQLLLALFLLVGPAKHMSNGLWKRI